MPEVRVSNFAARFGSIDRNPISNEETYDRGSQCCCGGRRLDVNRSVINRQFLGGGNLTLRRVAELAWALGWEIVFELGKPQAAHGQNHLPLECFTAVPTGAEEAEEISSIPLQTGTNSDDRIAA